MKVEKEEKEVKALVWQLERNPKSSAVALTENWRKILGENGLDWMGFQACVCPCEDKRRRK